MACAGRCDETGVNTIASTPQNAGQKLPQESFVFTLSLPLTVTCLRSRMRSRYAETKQARLPPVGIELDLPAAA